MPQRAVPERFDWAIRKESNELFMSIEIRGVSGCYRLVSRYNMNASRLWHCSSVIFLGIVVLRLVCNYTVLLLSAETSLSCWSMPSAASPTGEEVSRSLSRTGSL